ncbi:MAG: hypothetical protein M1835_005151 [Candelina submexicana]|nr:MAG: hypothetical protein M1835_005151 [Candelina submexicana]
MQDSTIITRSHLLRSKAQSFCNAFLKGTSPTETLDTFFTTWPKITEHGPSWATSRLPFLGKTFRGRRRQHSPSSSGAEQGSTCDDYFDLLATTLSFHPNQDTFPPAEGFIVDAGTDVADAGGLGAVSVVAHAKFASVATGKAWEEDFIYRLSEFDKHGKIGHWEIWADPLSAWTAVES